MLKNAKPHSDKNNILLKLVKLQNVYDEKSHSEIFGIK